MNVAKFTSLSFAAMTVYSVALNHLSQFIEGYLVHIDMFTGLPLAAMAASSIAL